MTADGSFRALAQSVAAHGVDLPLVRPDDATLTRVACGLRLPPDLVAVYADASPASDSAVPWVVVEMLIYSAAELPEALAGDRWTTPEREVLDDWSPGWVVVAQVLGDPYFVDLATTGPAVFVAMHGTGEWLPRQVAPSLPVFLDALARFESVLLGDYDDDVFTDDGLRSGFLEAVSARLDDQVSPDELGAFMESLT